MQKRLVHPVVTEISIQAESAKKHIKTLPGPVPQYDFFT